MKVHFKTFLSLFDFFKTLDLVILEEMLRINIYHTI